MSVCFGFRSWNGFATGLMEGEMTNEEWEKLGNLIKAANGVLILWDTDYIGPRLIWAGMEAVQKFHELREAKDQAEDICRNSNTIR